MDKLDGYNTEICLLKFEDNELKLYLKKSSEEKFYLPGGLVNKHEDGRDAALRILKKDTNIVPLFIRHVAVFDKPGRDYRGWIISNVFYAICEKEVELDGFYNVKDVLDMDLEYDHIQLIEKVLLNVNKDLLETKVARYFLESEFTIPELQGLLLNAYDGNEIKRTHFFTKIKTKDFIKKAVDENGEQKKKTSLNAKRPSNLYSFKDEKIVSSIYF